MITLNISRLSTTENVTEKFSNDSHNQITGVIHENFHKMSLLSSNTISSSNLKMQKFSSSWIIRTAIIILMMMASIIQASSSSLENYFNDDTGTSIMARPSPYSPDYHPECDIILPASYSFMNNLEEMTELSPPLPTQPQSLPPVINLDVNDNYPPPPPSSSSYYYPNDNDALTNAELILTNPNHHHGALGGISFRSSASTMHPILQKYLSAITG